MSLADEKEWAKEIASHIRYTISKKHVTSKGKKVRNHRFTPAMWGWMKGKFAGKWWGLPVFYIISFIEICHLPYHSTARIIVDCFVNYQR